MIFIIRFYFNIMSYQLPTNQENSNRYINPYQPVQQDPYRGNNPYSNNQNSNQPIRLADNNQFTGLNAVQNIGIMGQRGR
jgi:hypothetical protein